MANELFCPRCATPCLADASFCRSCGLQLGEIGAIVRGDSPKSQPDRYRPNTRIMRLGLGLFILGMVIALGSAALKSFNLFPEEYAKMVFLGFVMAGLACLGLGMVFPAKTRRSVRVKPGEAGLNPATTTSQLPSADLDAANAVFSVPARETVMAQPGSVTESTTRHLNKKN